MLGQVTEKLAKPFARYVHHGHMRRWGIANTMRLAKAYNRARYWRHDALRRTEYRKNFAELIRENGEPTAPIPEMRDGWALDTSLALPHLPRVLDDAEDIIAQRGGSRTSAVGAYRTFFQNLLSPDDLDRYPSLLEFALSSEVLSAVSNYLECIPALSTVHPDGLRLAESSAEYDDDPDAPHDSQLFHIDYYSKPNVYVIVLLRDVSAANGPFCFLPASLSRKAATTLRYWSRGKPYRLSDEEVYSVVDSSAVIRLTYPKGTVLFVDPSACFHYGSRNAFEPRYQLMIGYTTAIRTDLSEVYMKRRCYPHRPGDSRLRRLVLDRERVH